MYFKLKAFSKTGNIVVKYYHGASIDDIKKQAMYDGYFPINITCSRLIFKHRKTIQTSSMIIFNQELLTMLRAGIPLMQSLEFLANYNKNHTLRNILISTIAYLKEGMSFSQAIEMVGFFPKVYLANIIAGECSGNLIGVIARWIDFQIFAQKNRNRILEVLAYPILLILVMIISLVVIFNIVLPKFSEIYANSNIQMPLITIALLNIGKFMRSTLYIQGLFVIGLIFLIHWLITSPIGNDFLNRFLYKIPKIGNVYNMYHSSIFVRTMSILVASGMPIVQSLEVIQKNTSSVVQYTRLGKTIELIRSGSSLYLAIEKTQLLHPLAIEMTKVGEQASSLPDVLNYVADFFDQEITKNATVITAVIGPIMILIIGILVMGLLLAVYLPLFDIGNLAQY